MSRGQSAVALGPAAGLTPLIRAHDVLQGATSALAIIVSSARL